MAKIKKIVTSDIEGRHLSDGYGDSSFVYDTTGKINFYSENGEMESVLEPGIIYGANKDSADGYGRNTIKLIPNQEIVTDQYLIVDPTSPNHIHIRAGGVQDASTAELILGAENTNVSVVDSNGSVNILATNVNINSIAAPSSFNINTYSGATINSYRTSGYSDEHKIVATLGDIVSTTPTAIQWSPNFSATGLAFTGSGSEYPTYNSYYVKYGQLVTFWIEVDLTTVTNFGTGQYKLELPYAALPMAMNHFAGWVNVDPTVNPDNAGHAILNVDHLAGTTILDLHYVKQSGGANSPVMEAIFKQGSPVTLTSASKIYVNGTYISAQ